MSQLLASVLFAMQVKSIGMLDFSAIPPLLQPTMKAMVSLQQHMRPQALAITQSPYFTASLRQPTVPQCPAKVCGWEKGRAHKCAGTPSGFSVGIAKVEELGASGWRF